MSDPVLAGGSGATPQERERALAADYPDYGKLGIGVEAWVDLHQAEKDALARKLGDRSMVMLSWPTVRVLLALLRHTLANDGRAFGPFEKLPALPGEATPHE